MWTYYHFKTANSFQSWISIRCSDGCHTVGQVVIVKVHGTWRKARACRATFAMQLRRLRVGSCQHPWQLLLCSQAGCCNSQLVVTAQVHLAGVGVESQMNCSCSLYLDGHYVVVSCELQPTISAHTPACLSQAWNGSLWR